MVQEAKVSKVLETYFKQYQKIGERMRIAVAPIQKQHEYFQKCFQPLVESQKTLQKALEPILAKQKKLQGIIPSFELSKIALYDFKQVEKYSSSITRLIASAFKELQRSSRELPSKTRETLISLGGHGWFLDLEMPLSKLWKLTKALTDGNTIEAENALAEYYESRTDGIEKSIVARFPNREKLISAAFNAHRRQEYELSIPVFLAQADGICKEVVNEHLFLKHNKKPRTAIYVEQIASDAYLAALLSPLAQSLPINASENERDATFGELNRHMVLHGESLNYGNKTNSLKAISLLNYVAHVLDINKSTN